MVTTTLSPRAAEADALRGGQWTPPQHQQNQPKNTLWRQLNTTQPISQEAWGAGCTVEQWSWPEHRSPIYRVFGRCKSGL